MIACRQGLLTAILCLWAGAATAADKSGVGPNTISVPKGPGSIEGMGEAFQPTLNTGTAKHAIPFTVPPGTAGHTPSVGLAYEGGSGNGPLGFGWRMTVPYVQRQTEKGIPRYLDAANGLDDNHDGVVDDPGELDRFVNESKEELVGLSNGDYFSENEGAFVRYRRQGAGWVGTLPDGTVMVFGSAASAQVDDGAGRVFRWLLESSTDTQGNTIRFVHSPTPGAENLHQKYLTRIEYGPGAGPWTAFHFVQFDYEARSDWFEDCRSGFPIRTGQRLKRVVVCTQGVGLTGHQSGDRNGDGKPDYLNRRYDLAYASYAGADTHWSYLESVTVIGADNASSLPPAKYGYSVCNPPASLSAVGKITGAQNPPLAVMDNPLVDLVDMNGDGLPDILKTDFGGGAHSVAYNLGESVVGGSPVIKWANPSEVATADGQAWGINLQSGAAPGDAVAHLSDMDADGTADLVYHTPFDTVYFFRNLHRAGWGPRQPMIVDGEAPPSPFGDLDTKTADIDFDKRMDIIQSQPVGGGVHYRVWYNLGSQRYSDPVTIAQDDGVMLSDKSVNMADWNGDRMPDMVRIRPMELEISASWGYGNFSPLRRTSIPNVTLTTEQIANASLRDITGDGLADLVVEKAEPGVLWYWINLGNDRLAPRRIITGLPVGDAQAAIRWADLNGNSTTDYIVASALNNPPIQSVDLGTLLSWQSASSLMNRIENGIGRVTQIEYSTSTSYALADAAAGSPWVDPVPFPVSVVSRVLTGDSLGHSYETFFTYHDGFYDGVEQEFRGFGRVEVTEVGDSSAPTLVTRSWFDTGRSQKAMKGRLLRLTSEQADGGQFTDDLTAWEDPPRLLYTGTDGREVRYAVPREKRKHIVEKGQGTERLLLSEMDFDNYGNQTALRDYGIVEGANLSAFNDERFTTTLYARNLAAWILRTVAQTEVGDENGAVISRSRSFYDDESFSGGNYQQVTVGNLTLRQDWVDPGAGTFIKAVRNKYDAFGNVREIHDPISSGGVSAGHMRSLQWDSALHSYPVTETIQIGQGKSPLVYQADYDGGFGVVTAATDFNANPTSFGYDAFGRLTSIINPGDTAALPTAEYSYYLAVPVTAGLVNFVESRSLDRDGSGSGAKADHYLISRDFVDGLGRKLMTKTEAESAGGSSRVTVKGAVRFNARAKPASALNPYFSSSGMDFENIEASGWSGSFSRNGSLVTLGLANAHQSISGYDATLRELTFTNPDGSSRRTAYEPLRTISFDENDNDPASQNAGTPMVHTNDGLGRLVQVAEVCRLNDDGTPGGGLKSWITGYEYDLNDQLTKITDSQNNVKVMGYDGLKRKTFMNDPDRGVMHFIFDDASNLRESTDAKGQLITYTYDGTNRILSEDYHDEGRPFSGNHSFNPQAPVSAGNRPDVAYFYDEPQSGLDQGDGSSATASNVNGKLAYVWDLSGEEHTSYDARDRVAYVVKRVRDPLHGQLVSYRTGFAYDSLDRLTKLTYPDNDEIGYHYNERSLLSRITGGPSGSIISNLSYLPSGQQGEILYGNGISTSYAYDSRLRLNSLVTAPQADPASPLIAFGYDFDGVSNIKSISDNRPTSQVPAGDKRRNTQIFQYDDLYRLTRVQYSFALPGGDAADGGDVNYRYDRIGNMLAQNSSITETNPHSGQPVANLGEMESGGTGGRSGRTGRAAGDSPGPHALTAIHNGSATAREYPYDANGNMANLDGMVATWDFKDRLVALEDATMRADYTYDFTDRRITKRVTKKTAAPGTTVPRVTYPFTTIYVGKHFEVREFDAPTKFIFNGDTRVARVTGNLSPGQRVQRLRVSVGWNLVSVAVTAASGGTQLAATSQTDGIFKWDPASRNFAALSPTETIPAGSVLWLKALANTTLRVVGPYPGPIPSLRAPPAGDFLPGHGLEVWPVPGRAKLPSTTLWRFAPDLQNWQSRVPFLNLSDLPPAIGPHEAIYAQSSTAVDLDTPSPALSLRFYHQDHIGSSSVMSDAAGALVEESANYPFGSPRSEFRPRIVREDYQFTQKECDVESGLHYFQARLLAACSGRFISVDALANSPSPSAVAAPQRLNCYAYGLNSPFRMIDPDGRDAIDTFNDGLKSDDPNRLVLYDTLNQFSNDQFKSALSARDSAGTSLNLSAIGHAVAGATAQVYADFFVKGLEEGVTALAFGRTDTERMKGLAKGLSEAAGGRILGDAIKMVGKAHFVKSFPSVANAIGAEKTEKLMKFMSGN